MAPQRELGGGQGPAHVRAVSFLWAAGSLAGTFPGANAGPRSPGSRCISGGVAELWAGRLAAETHAFQGAFVPEPSLLFMALISLGPQLPTPSASPALRHGPHPAKGLGLPAGGQAVVAALDEPGCRPCAHVCTRPGWQAAPEPQGSPHAQRWDVPCPARRASLLAAALAVPGHSGPSRRQGPWV